MFSNIALMLAKLAVNELLYCEGNALINELPIFLEFEGLFS